MVPLNVQLENSMNRKSKFKLATLVFGLFLTLVGGLIGIFAPHVSALGIVFMVIGLVVSRVVRGLGVVMILTLAGCLIMISAPRVWILGPAVIGLGVCLSLLARKGDRQQQISVTSARKKTFVIFVVVFVVSCISWPFLLYRFKSNVNLHLLIVVISVALLPLEIGFLYWCLFKKPQSKEISQPVKE